MNDKQREICELFVRNRDELQEKLRWKNRLLYPVCASIYTQKGKIVDCVKIKECIALIKKKTGIFSNFRGIANLVLATLLSLEDDPENQLNHILNCHNALRKEFSSSAYLPLTATFMADRIEEESMYEPIVRKARAIYMGIKEDHPIITSAEDSGMVALLALSDDSETRMIKEVETCYQILKPSLTTANAVQALSMTLALSEESAESKCKRAIGIYERLKEVKCKYGRGTELATLGTIVLEKIGIDQAVEEIREISDYLLASGGFGSFGVGKSQRIMYATMLMMFDKTSDSSMNVTAVSTVTSVIIAQQVALCSAVAASAASS